MKKLLQATSKQRWLQLVGYCKGLILVLGSSYFFFYPLVVIINDLRAPSLYSGTVPNVTYRWHQDLSPSFGQWAEERVASQRAAALGVGNISGTEWPIFSAVYYLWATEALQTAWVADPTVTPTAPIVYARDAIEAAATLVADPNHASWVQTHWGADYLTQENIFYRMLLISGLTSYQTLLGDGQYAALLTSQVDLLAAELDQSAYGLLDDYPGQCYPIDILPAIAVIQRADVLLGLDHSEMIARAVRGFEETRLDAGTMLPAYIADSRTGVGHGPARGVGISYMLIWAPEVWPDVAADWYRQYEAHFWQEGILMSGVREFSREGDYPTWFADVDAGPVVGGYGTAATAFGLGATRANGRLDHAAPLTSEALVASWPLPNGTLLGPRLLSNLSDAPYIGETALLFALTRTPVTGEVVVGGGKRPLLVWVGLFFYAGMGGVGLWGARGCLRRKPVSSLRLLPRSKEGSRKGRKEQRAQRIVS